VEMLIGQKPGQAGMQAGAAAPAPDNLPGNLIVDGDQASFMADVVEASRQTPVLVDFWATWCGPCKTLTPILEKVVRAAGGRVRMVKIDIDRNQALVRQLAQLGLPMQSVPTVAAFWQGQIADIMQGAQPESEVKRFVETLLKAAGGSMPSADLIAEARVATEQGQHDEACGLFSAVLEQEPENPEAWGGLIRGLLALGQEEQALEALEQVPEKIAGHAEIAGARAALALASEGHAAAAQLTDLEAQVQANPADHEARYNLATALNATDRREEAAAALLHIIGIDRGWNEGAARLQLLKFFEAWGFGHEVTMTARRKLSAILFS
jgi:putative thioredoxin